MSCDGFKNGDHVICIYIIYICVCDYRFAIHVSPFRHDTVLKIKENVTDIIFLPCVKIKTKKDVCKSRLCLVRLYYGASLDHRDNQP